MVVSLDVTRKPQLAFHTSPYICSTWFTCDHTKVAHIANQSQKPSKCQPKISTLWSFVPAPHVAALHCQVRHEEVLSKDPEI